MVLDNPGLDLQIRLLMDHFKQINEHGPGRTSVFCDSRRRRDYLKSCSYTVNRRGPVKSCKEV